MTPDREELRRLPNIEDRRRLRETAKAGRGVFSFEVLWLLDTLDRYEEALRAAEHYANDSRFTAPEKIPNILRVLRAALQDQPEERIL